MRASPRRAGGAAAQPALTEGGWAGAELPCRCLRITALVLEKQACLRAGHEREQQKRSETHVASGLSVRANGFFVPTRNKPDAGGAGLRAGAYGQEPTHEGSPLPGWRRRRWDEPRLVYKGLAHRLGNAQTNTQLAMSRDKMP